MRSMPDKSVDAVITDPPYGIGEDVRKADKSGRTEFTTDNRWDLAIPEKLYFSEIFRISKNQIIWGGNYFDLPPTQCFIFWYKQNPVPNFADGELAWTSSIGNAKHFDRSYQQDDKAGLHPTQKPIELYRWLLHTYANKGDKILDTHLGSGSIAIAVEKANRLDKMNLQFVGIEIDKEYYEKALNRIEQYCRQGTLSF